MRPPPYEPDGVSARGVLLAIAIVVALVAVCVLGANLLAQRLERAFDARPPRSSALVAPPVDGPALQAAPALDLARLREEDNARLHAYRWIDRPRGVVQIPIERAIAILSERSTRQGQPQ